MNILYLLNEDKFEMANSEQNLSKESMSTISGPFYLEDEIYEHINKLIEKKFINGYADGTYGAFNNVTRAEFVKMLDVFGYLPTEKAESNFIDTDGHWAETYINKAAGAGIINGFSEEYFMPDNNITIEQVLAILDRKLSDQIVQIQNAFIKTYTAEFLTSANMKVALNNCRILTDDEKDYLNNYEEKYRPNQAEYYPYVSNEIPSEVYDFPFIVDALPDMSSPATVHQSSNISYYESGAKHAEIVLNKLLNIDYETISYEDIYTTLNAHCIGSISYSYGSEEAVKNYVEYVKENKIKIKGTATSMLPIMYIDGMSCRVRMKIEFTIESSDTNLNLLLKPSYGAEDFVYDKTSYSFYTDVAMSRPINTPARYYLPEDIMQEFLISAVTEAANSMVTDVVYAKELLKGAIAEVMDDNVQNKLNENTARMNELNEKLSQTLTQNLDGKISIEEMDKIFSEIREEQLRLRHENDAYEKRRQIESADHEKLKTIFKTIDEMPEEIDRLADDYIRMLFDRIEIVSKNEMRIYSGEYVHIVNM